MLMLESPFTGIEARVVIKGPCHSCSAASLQGQHKCEFMIVRLPCHTTEHQPQMVGEAAEGLMYPMTWEASNLPKSTGENCLAASLSVMYQTALPSAVFVNCSFPTKHNREFFLLQLL